MALVSCHALAKQFETGSPCLPRGQAKNPCRGVCISLAAAQPSHKFSATVGVKTRNSASSLSSDTGRKATGLEGHLSLPQSTTRHLHLRAWVETCIRPGVLHIMANDLHGTAYRQFVHHPFPTNAAKQGLTAFRLTGQGPCAGKRANSLERCNRTDRVSHVRTSSSVAA